MSILVNYNHRFNASGFYFAIVLKLKYFKKCLWVIRKTVVERNMNSFLTVRLCFLKFFYFFNFFFLRYNSCSHISLVIKRNPFSNPYKALKG